MWRVGLGWGALQIVDVEWRRVRKRVADSPTYSGSETASACGRGSVVRICRLMSDVGAIFRDPQNSGCYEAISKRAAPD